MLSKPYLYVLVVRIGNSEGSVPHVSGAFGGQHKRANLLLGARVVVVPAYLAKVIPQMSDKPGRVGEKPATTTPKRATDTC